MSHEQNIEKLVKFGLIDKEKFVGIGAKLDEALHHRVSIHAMKQRMTLSQFIKNALVDYCDKLEGQVDKWSMSNENKTKE